MTLALWRIVQSQGLQVGEVEATCFVAGVARVTGESNFQWLPASECEFEQLAQHVEELIGEITSMGQESDGKVEGVLFEQDGL